MAASTSYSKRPGPRRPHPGLVGVAGDRRALLHHAQLVRRLHLPQVRQDAPRVGHADVEEPLARLVGELERLRQRSRRRRRRAQRQRQAGAAGGHGREEGRVLLRLRQPRRAERRLREHRGQERLELAAVVDGRDAAFGGRFVLGQDVAVPVLAPGVRLGHEQDLALRFVAGHQHQDGVWLGDAGQIQEVAVLTVLVVDVEREHARGRAPHDRQRLRRQPLHHPRAPGLEVVLQRAGEDSVRD